MIALLTSTRCTIVPVMSEGFGDQRCKALPYLHLRNFLPCSRINKSGLQAVYPGAVTLRHVMTQGLAFQRFKDSSFEEHEVRSGARHLIGTLEISATGWCHCDTWNFTPCLESAVACTLPRSSRRCGDSVNWSSEAIA